MSAHSQVGASSLYRWSKCPGSVALSANLPESNSIHAAGGSVAHGIAERCFKENVHPITFLGDVINHSGFDIEVDEEMVSAVALYVDAVNKACIDSNDTIGVLTIEEQFDLSKIYEGMFGTADAVIWLPKAKILRVLDFKYGAGQPVNVIGNTQLRFYALGALLKGGYPAITVEMGVVQPRCPHPDGFVRFDSMDAIDLIDFAADIEQYAIATEAKDAPLVPGDHCRYCKAAAAVCPAIKDKAQELAKMEFTPPLPYQPEELARALTWLPVLETWCENVRKFAYAEAEAGRTPIGFKLVDKVARRHWTDETSAVKDLMAITGTDGQEFWRAPEIKTVAQVEKLLSKEQKKSLEALVVKKSSGHTLVAVTDKRQAIKSDAKSDFTESSAPAS